MRLEDILAVKGTTVFTTSPEVSLAEVVRLMVENNIGSMLVCQRDLTLGERLVGILTERDMLRCFAAGKCDLTQLKVADVMTPSSSPPDPPTRSPT